MVSGSGDIGVSGAWQGVCCPTTHTGVQNPAVIHTEVDSRGLTAQLQHPVRHRLHVEQGCREEQKDWD